MTGFIDEATLGKIRGEVVFFDPNRGHLQRPVVLMVNGERVRSGRRGLGGIDYNWCDRGEENHGKATMQQLLWIQQPGNRRPDQQNEMGKITPGNYTAEWRNSTIEWGEGLLLLPGAFDGIDYRENFLGGLPVKVRRMVL